MKRHKISVSISLGRQDFRKMRWVPFLVGLSAGVVFLTFYNFFWLPFGQYLFHF